MAPELGIWITTADSTEVQFGTCSTEMPVTIVGITESYDDVEIHIPDAEARQKTSKLCKAAHSASTKVTLRIRSDGKADVYYKRERSAASTIVRVGQTIVTEPGQSFSLES